MVVSSDRRWRRYIIKSNFAYQQTETPQGDSEEFQYSEWECRGSRRGVCVHGLVCVCKHSAWELNTNIQYLALELKGPPYLY